jgi:hypothetical protein
MVNFVDHCSSWILFLLAVVCFASACVGQKEARPFIKLDASETGIHFL